MATPGILPVVNGSLRSPHARLPTFRATYSPS